MSWRQHDPADDRIAFDNMSSDEDGTGLGLQLCKSGVELQGGTPELDSVVDFAITVTVRFPSERKMPMAAVAK